MKRPYAKITTMAFALVLLGVCVRAYAAGSAQNWSVTLKFSTPQNADLMPVSVGESSAATQLLKPPPFPGLADTGDQTDAVVNAYVASAARKAAQDVYAVNSTAPGRAWVITVETEQPGVPVSVKPDLANFYEQYNLFLFDPSTGVVTSLLDKDGKDTAIFTSDNSGSHTMFLVSGRSGTLAVSNGTTLTGIAMVNGRETPIAGAEVYLDGSNTVAATTDAKGVFSVSGVTATDHNITIKMPTKLPSAGTVNVAGAGYGTPIVMADMYAGDLCCANTSEGESGAGNGIIDGLDYAAFKQRYGSTCTNPPACTTGAHAPDRLPYDEKWDFDGDGDIDGIDFAIFKRGYGKGTAQW